MSLAEEEEPVKKHFFTDFFSGYWPGIGRGGSLSSQSLDQEDLLLIPTGWKVGKQCVKDKLEELLDKRRKIDPSHLIRMSKLGSTSKTLLDFGIPAALGYCMI